MSRKEPETFEKKKVVESNFKLAIASGFITIAFLLIILQSDKWLIFNFSLFIINLVIFVINWCLWWNEE